jgi:transposase
LIKKTLDQSQTIQALIKKVDNLTERVHQLEKFEKENKELREKNTKLQQENIELKARLNSNSKNSNKPPSSDGYKKHPALPKKKKGRQGGQKGHKGSTLHQIENPDKIIGCIPESCTCGHIFTKENYRITEKRQIFDLPQPKLEVTEYQIYTATCPSCGLKQKGTVPEGISSPAQYGNSLKALAILLNVHYKLPYKKIGLLFNDLFGYSINGSTIFSSSKNCYNKLEESENIIKSKIINQQVAHADETGLRVEGNLHWLHTATTQLYTYFFVHKKRGTEALQSEKSILDQIIGWLVHDCWGSYFKFNNIQHAICGAHILRELQGLIDREQSKWAKVFKIFFMNIYEMPFKERIKRKEHIISRYDRICEIAEKAEPPPIKIPGKKGKRKRTKGRNLVERLIREKEAVLAFAFNKNVPFTNNLAERDIRPAKIKQKISNCFRSFRGAEIYARIESFISTARKNNCNVFSELCNTFEGYNFLTQQL